MLPDPIYFFLFLDPMGSTTSTINDDQQHRTSIGLFLNDLALRIARAYAKKKYVICVSVSCHVNAM
jgi:hypothetical protein